MKTDLERIKFIENIFGFKLKKVEPENINHKDFYTVNISDFSLSYILNPSFPYKGVRNYCLDKDNKLTGLSLDFSPVFLFPNGFLNEFKYINFLSLRSSGITDVSFLTELKRLTSLDLSFNNLSDVSFLTELKQLTNLDLRNNSINDVSFLKDLKGLTSLDIRNNNLNLSNGSFLTELKRLTSLDLRNTKLKGYSFLTELKGLTSLDLSNTSLESYSFLTELKGLTSLYLSNTLLESYSFLTDLKGLTNLDLSFNNLSNVSFLTELKRLTNLDLSSNNLSNVSFLAELKGLTNLDLSNTSLESYSFLAELKGLSSLDLSSNKLKDYSFLKELKGLTSLYLSYTSLESYSFLAELKGLSSLDLSSNKLKDYSFLKELKGLTSLYLSYTSLESYSFLTDLKGLTSLYLSNTLLESYSFLTDLKGLTNLDLSFNNLSDVSFLTELKRLTNLDLAKNQIKEIPNWLTNIGLEIRIDNEIDFECINLYGNPIEMPPLELVMQGNTAIIEWFTANKKKLNEVKVLLVGEAKAGKTSLMRRLLDNSYSKQESQTDGIIIEEFDFSKLKTFTEQEKLHGIKAYFWDFGGQEIMSSTHQFFMTKRSLYILVMEARKDNNAEQQVNQWLKKIRTLGGNSQVIVVVNKMDINQAFGLDEYNLKKNFPQIKQFIYISCEKSENIDQVKCALEKYIPEAELFNTEIDERWFPIKEKLQEDTSKAFYIPERKFEQICVENHLTEKSQQDSAIGFLNDLGIILHFKELKLAEFYVLDPYWVTSGVYRIINSEEAGKNNGIVEVEHLREIVNNPKINENIGLMVKK
jgi:small GTP-binding protein